MALSLDLKQNGIELRFDSRTQRLEMIRIYDLSQLELAYGSEDRVFSAPESIPSLQIIYDKFGPTFAGRYSADKTEYVLEYPGLAFTFPIPAEKRDIDDVKQSGTHSEASLDPSRVPQSLTHAYGLEMPRSLDIRLKTIHVWREGDRASSSSDLLVVVNVGEGISIMPEAPARVAAPPSQSVALSSPQSSMIGGVLFSSRASWTLDFNSSTQDVLQALGEPDQIFYKVEDPLSIHKADETPNLDYFYNYFRFGFDILFDGTQHTVKKYILWTNMPSQPLFTKYEKCNFQIIAPEWARLNRKRNPAVKLNNGGKRKGRAGSDAPMAASMGPFSSSPKRPGANPELDAQKDNLLDLSEEVAGSPARRGSVSLAQEKAANKDDVIVEHEDELDAIAVHPDMKWREIETVFGPPVGKPFLAPGQEYSPFVGGTTFYAYPDIIFEVMENDYLVKVILFKD